MPITTHAAPASPAGLSLNGIKLVRYPELAEKFGIKFVRETIWRLEQKRKFPLHVDLGANSIAWVESEIENWLKAKIEARADIATPGNKAEAAGGSSLDQLPEVMSLGVEKLGMTAKAVNALKRAKIATVKDLVGTPAAELLQLPRLGRNSLGSIESALSARGLHLGMTGSATPPALK